MSADRSVAVFGAYGHTARFVIDELRRRGWNPILSGRDPQRLAALAAAYPDLQRRPASVDDSASLDRALHGASAVINCAGPFLDTATPVVEAALRARIHYLDVCAEQPAVLGVHERFAKAARDAGSTVIPAMAFFGGLADLLATTALGDWPDAEAIDIGVAMDSWHPTPGTRRTGARNHGPRRVVSNGRLEWLASPSPSRRWDFPEPFGSQEVEELPLSEIITLSRHVRAAEIHSYMSPAPLRDLRDPQTPPPSGEDAQGRSSQHFLVEAIVRRQGRLRRAAASGRDIYAITAPLVVEALQRIHDGRCRSGGVLAPGQAFDASDFLAATHDLRFQPADR